MPCRGPEISRRQLSEEREEMRRQRDTVTALLCYACRQFTEEELQDMPELYRWFQKHDAEDQARLQRETEEAEKRLEAASRKRYLAGVRKRLESQLSDDELEALGVSK